MAPRISHAMREASVTEQRRNLIAGGFVAVRDDAFALSIPSTTVGERVAARLERRAIHERVRAAAVVARPHDAAVAAEDFFDGRAVRGVACVGDVLARGAPPAREGAA